MTGKLGYRLATILAASIALCGSVPAVAGVGAADCPLAGRPYSLDSSVYDILTYAPAKATVDRLAPGFLVALPTAVTGTKLPALSGILSLGMMGQQRLDPAVVARIATVLATLPVTPEADRLRCARYDQGKPPALPRLDRRPALLVFDRSTGFRDAPSIDAAAAALRAMAAKNGWQLVFTDRAASFNRRDLARFAGVIWNNVSGDVLTLSQRAAFRTYIEQGGGYVGIHGSNGDPLTLWDWYSDSLIGARFKGHPAKPQFQDARVVVDDPNGPITRGLGTGWTMREEWYSFRTNPRDTGAHVLATLDENSYAPSNPQGDLRMGDHPIAWTRRVGKGRSFYTAIGHLPESYDQPSARRLLDQGIQWVTTRGQ